MELEQLGLPTVARQWRVWLVVSMVVVALIIGLSVYVVLNKVGDSDARMICRARYADRVLSAQVDGQISQGFLIDALARQDMKARDRFLGENIASIIRLDEARAERLAYGATQSLPCPIRSADVFIPPPVTAPSTTVPPSPSTTT